MVCQKYGIWSLYTVCAWLGDTEKQYLSILIKDQKSNFMMLVSLPCISCYWMVFDNRYYLYNRGI